MIMKKIMKTISLILVLAMLLSTYAFAAETRSSAYLFSYCGVLSRTSSGKLLIEFDATGMGTMTAIGASTIKVYKSNGQLVKAYYYTDTGCSGMLGYNTTVHGSSLTYTGVAGETYYCIITFYARNANGYDSKNYATHSCTL